MLPFSNQLAHASSPYLRQHRDNPVAWQLWDPRALEIARELDKPLLISIGYASCHWCHVMAHESFEDDDTAALINASFIPIKVDREERPDLDAIYMAATQAQTGHGGWPMTVFATPDGRPFYCGTYFPPTDRHGMPGFSRLLSAMADAWANHRDDVETQANELSYATEREVRFSDSLASDVTDKVSIEPLALVRKVVDELEPRFDATYGGFGPAPKFPRPSLVELCLIDHLATGSATSLTMATTTLDAMAAGGIYDHLVGGFCRYSTDEQWLVPHFEKMLTDQALLARAYLHAYAVTGRSDYRQVAIETLDYVLDELAAEIGGLYSSHDADAGGIEGAHATFTKTSVRLALEAGGAGELTDAVCAFYEIGDVANFEGASIPHRPLGASLARPADIERGRILLNAARHRRVQPERDEKVLLEWNAMAAAVLAEAASITGEQRFAAAAESVLLFVLNALTRSDGRLQRSFSEGGAHHLALAADYAWLIEACTRLYELTASHRWLGQACEVADAMLAGFWDGPPPTPGDPTPRGPGGFFLTGHDADPLVVRPKDTFDGATPAANSVAALALARLAKLSAMEHYDAAAQRIIERSGRLLTEHPSAVADLVLATLVARGGAEVVIPGPGGPLLDVARARWLPTAVVVYGEPTDTPLFEGRTPGVGYVCQHFTCGLGAQSPDDLDAQLDALVSSARFAR